VRGIHVVRPLIISFDDPIIDQSESSLVKYEITIILVLGAIHRAGDIHKMPAGNDPL
jgi:hypothetical protein